MRMTYTVDIVFCIDATASMGPCINVVKEKALSFYDDFVRALAEENKYVDSIRIKVIAFRDYLADKEPILVTDFFNLPDDRADFSNTIKGIVESGGGDEPEDGLEALAYAIRSD